MILNGEYVEKLTDEELCMLEQLTCCAREDIIVMRSSPLESKV